MAKLKLDMDLGSNLQKLRLRTGMSQEKVVAELQLMGFNLHRVALSRMERNDYNIRVSELLALKKIYKATFEEIFDGLTIK